MKALPIVASSAVMLTILGLNAASVVPAESPVPSVETSEGHTNSAGFRPLGNMPPLRYPAPENFGSYGTFSAWVRLDEPVTANGALFSAGSPDAGWILFQASGAKLSFLIQRGTKPFAGEGECYLNLSAPIDGWTPGSWHHVTVAWDARGQGQSLAALFIDGQMVEERNTASLAENWGPSTLFIGANSANASAPRIAGSLDQVAVFPYAVPPGQIAALLDGNATGASLFVDFEYGPDAKDLRPSSDDAAARAESRAQWAR